MARHDDPTMRSIRRQALHGFLIVALGFGVAYLLGQGHDMRALDKDPTPIVPGIVIAMVGALWMVIARIRMVFHRPKTLLKAGGKKLIGSLLQGLGE